MPTKPYKMVCCTGLLLTIAACTGGDDGKPATGTGGGDHQEVRVVTPDPGTPTHTLADADTDHEKIQGCWSKTACPQSYAQMTDDYYTKLDQANGACLMLGLSFRTPGLYLHNTSSSSARGEDSTQHAFLVLDSASVVHTSKRTTSGGQFAQQGTAGVTHIDAERCELAGSSYFDDCSSAIRASATPEFNDPGWGCLFSDPASAWLGNCESVDAACE